MKTQNNEKKVYYNKLEFERICKLSRINPNAAVEQFKKYIEEYPEDYTAIPYYIFQLISTCEFVEADEKIKELEKEFKKGFIYKDDPKRSTLLAHDIKLCKLKLYLNAGLKKKAVEYYKQNCDEFSCLGKEIEFYIKKLNGELDLERRSPNSYEFRQIVSYDEKDFLDNLESFLSDYCDDEDKLKTKHFSPDFPVDDVLEEVKKKMDIENRICNGYIDNMFIFKYNHCGRDGSKPVDYFKVRTFCYSNDIIAMYPANGCDYLPYIDLNYLKEKEEPKSLVKRPSQIDKFRQRYNLK